MAIRRSGHWVSQLRVDVPDMRALESAVRNDFDEMVQAFITGDQLSFVLRGFEINMTGAVGNAANGLAVVVSDSAILHTTSMTSGTIFKVSPGAPVEILSSTVNTKVTGNFSPNSTNYVSIDFSRAPDSSTQAPRAIWDPTNKIETSKVLPIAQLMTYTFKITTTGFAADTLPMAIVQTDAANNVTSITDRRPMLFRLGQAGFQAPNPSYEYPWNNQTEGRTENPSTSAGGLNPFHGGDKMLKSLKEWMDAVMSILKEIHGGIYWYSLGTGGSTTSVRQDGINTVITGRATVTHNLITPGLLNWNQPINSRVIGSRATYVISANNVGTDMTLADGQVAYANLVRDKQVVPNLIFTNGGTVVTSVGAISWTTDLVAGDYIKAEGTGVEGYYRIQSVDSISQVTLSTPYEGLSTGPSGTNAIYSFGVYNVVPAPSTNRHVFIADREDVPITEDMYWLFFRDDNGGSVAKIYTRFKAGELEQGESQEVSDQVSLQLLQFIGALSESDDSPAYFSNNYVTDGDSLVQAISDLDAAAGGSATGARQDRSSKLIEGGTWSVNLAGTDLTLSADAYIQLAGIANDRNRIAAQTIAFPNAASVAYVEINRADPGVAGLLTVNVVDVDALVPTDNTVIIARRVTAGIMVGQHSFLLKAGEYLELDGANAEIQRLLGQLRLRNHESTVGKVRIDAAAKSLLNGHTLEQVIGNFLLDFTGAVINFSTGAILKEDDVTALGNNFTPFTIPVGEYFWYGVGLLPGAITADNKQLATVLVTPATAANAVQATAPKPVVSGTIKLGAIQVQNIGGTITVVDVHRLGVGSGSGGGSGQGASFDAELRTYLKLSPYEYVEPNIFPVDEDDKVDISSTGSYSPATTYFQTDTGQTLVTWNLLDPDFIADARPLAKARVILRYAPGLIDPAPVVELSKNGGAFTAVSMTRIGTTDTFDGELDFDAAVGTSLVMRVTASADSEIYGYGVMYDTTFVAIPLGISKYIHPVTFSGDDNETAFVLPFLPDPKSLVVYDITRGQSYIYDPANTFSISGQTITFVADSFNFPGETIKLEFRQIVGNGFDNSDQNANDIAVQNQNLLDLGDELDAQNLSHVVLAKIAVPNTTVLNRPLMPDLTQDLGVRFGMDRFALQQIYPVQGEYGPAGQNVWAVANDRFSQFRLVGSGWVSNNETNGAYPATTILDDYIEITFVGTGLNILANTFTAARDWRASVDGGAEGANLYAAFVASGSSILINRNYPQNTVIPVVSGLSYGLHTVKLRNNSSGQALFAYGFEFLTESSTGLLRLAPGSQVVKGKRRTHGSLETVLYNSVFESGTLGTRGGRVVVYQKSDGTIAKAVNPTDAAASALAFAGAGYSGGNANHANEELVRVYNWREFGAARADDFSLSVTAGANRAFTLDDGTTSLVGLGAAPGSDIQAIGTNVVGDYLTFTFVGTGLDLLQHETPSTFTGVQEILIDNTQVFLGNLGTVINKGVWRVVSGLPYGTHTFKYRKTVGGSGLSLFDFRVYAPKKPTIPAGSVEIMDYCIPANFVANTVGSPSNTSLDAISTGVIRKMGTREMAYVGTWSIGTIDATFTSGFSISTAQVGAYAEYTFFGTGFDLRMFMSTAGSGNVQLTLDGSITDFTPYTTGFAGPAGTGFTAATGVVDSLASAGSGFASTMVTGLPLGKHTIRATVLTTGMSLQAIDIVTPAHSVKNNGPFVVQNALSIGSQALNDLRKFGEKDVPQENNAAQTAGVASNPSYSSTVDAPMPDMSVTHVSKTGKIRISFGSPVVSNTPGNGISAAVYVDGAKVKNYNSYTNGSGYVGDSFLRKVAPGFHKIDIHWASGGGTSMTARATDRSLTVEDVE